MVAIFPELPVTVFSMVSMRLLLLSDTDLVSDNLPLRSLTLSVTGPTAVSMSVETPEVSLRHAYDSPVALR